MANTLVLSGLFLVMVVLASSVSEVRGDEKCYKSWPDCMAQHGELKLTCHERCRCQGREKGFCRNDHESCDNGDPWKCECEGDEPKPKYC